MDDDAKRPFRLLRRRIDASREAVVLEEPDERFSLDISRSRSDALLIAASQSHTTGEARIVLKRGLVQVVGTRSPYSLIDSARATYGETQSLWSAEDAAGFCRIYGLQGAIGHEALRRAEPAGGGS